ncbi:MAG: family 78 glycoside hydrolase catalytic domain [Bryobacterales bacterium]|nr:family 78 glycoside hydrolase catalytic domain [Bryobacterales bacterium]
MISRRNLLRTAALAPAALQAAEAGFEPTGLRCEYAVDPLGIDAVPPRFSWQLDRATQSAWQIVVESNGRPLWDSGRVTSDHSTQVAYAGPALQARQRCVWKVRVWDSSGAVSRWSAPARFEMGLLAASDWRARWIMSREPEGDSAVRTLPGPWFRHVFRLTGRPQQARAYISGLGYYELSINGRKVGDHVLSPGQTEYDKRRIRRLLYPFDDQTAKRVQYVTYDVTGHLVEGENVAGVVLGNGWYDQRDRVVEGWLWYDTPRFILVIEGDNGELLAATGEDWRVTTAGPILHNAIFTGESYDARLEMPGWDATSYDDSSWNRAAVARPPAGRLVAEYQEPNRVVETLHPTADGVNSFDAGRGVSGWVRLRARGARGRKVTLRFREEQGPDYGQADSYVLKGEGLETWEPRFTWHAFRHVDVIGSTEGLELDVRVVHDDVARAGEFQCSNQLFNQIHETYVRTQLANMHGGVPSDCPHRERLGYTGDGQVAAQSAIYALDMARFYTKWIDDIADARNHATGFVPHTAPFEGGGGGPPWGSAMVLLPWYLYLYYGDRRVLGRHYDAMTAWVRYLGTRTDASGVVVKEEPGGWFLGDWLPPRKIKIPPEFVCTCFLAHCADLVSKIAAVLGRQQDAAAFAQVRDRAASAIEARFFEAARNQYAGGEQGANFFALAFGLVPEARRRAVLDRAVQILEQEQDSHFDTGFIGTPLVLDVLTEMGHSGLAQRLMNQRDFPSLGYMLARGATTLWESWDGGGSHMHPMYGGACRWFWQGLAGIHPDAGQPGFRHFFVRPALVDGIDWVQASYRSLRGPISVHWRRQAGGVRLEVEVPGNSRCTVELPGGRRREVGPGKSTLEA